MLPTLQNKLKQAIAGGNTPLIRRLSGMLERHWRKAEPLGLTEPRQDGPLSPTGEMPEARSEDPKHVRDVATDDQDERDPRGHAWGTPRIAAVNAARGEDAYGAPAESLTQLIYGLQLSNETAVGIRKKVNSRETKGPTGWSIDQQDLLRY